MTTQLLDLMPSRKHAVVACLWSVCVLGCLPALSAGESRELRLGVPWPPGSQGMTRLQTAARRLARETDGRVRLRFVEQEGFDPEGAALAGGLLAGPELIRRSPSAGLFALPLLLRCDEDVARARALVDPLVESELRAAGLEPAALLHGGFAYLHSRVPLQTVAQFKEARLWVPPDDAEFLELAGAHGMAVEPCSVRDVRHRLQQDRVEVLAAPPVLVILQQWHPELRYVIDTPFLCLYAALVWKKDALAGLSEGDRDTLARTLARTLEESLAEMRRQELEALEVLARHGLRRDGLDGPEGRGEEWKTWADAVAGYFLREERIDPDLLDRVRSALNPETRERTSR